MDVLKTTNLTKIYDERAVVDNVNMTIKEGEIYGFIGKNGAGKTTFMRLILTLCRPTEGKIELFGNENIIEECSKVGSLIETPSLYTGLSAYDNLKMYSILFGDDEKRIRKILELIGLDNTGNKKVSQFSLGMKQRLGIGIALLGNPKLLILDEPINGLDPIGIKEIRDTIIRLNKEENITFLISSHLLDELAKIASRVGIINNGKLCEELSIEELNARCGQDLHIEADDINRAVKIIEKEIKKEDIRIDKNMIIISNASEKAGYINKLLVNNDIIVNALYKESKNLEEFYFEKLSSVN